MGRQQSFFLFRLLRFCFLGYQQLRKPDFLRFYRIELLATAFLLLRQNQKLKEGLSAKLDRIGADLEKARKKRAEWDAKVKDLERRYHEEENSEIHEMTRTMGTIQSLRTMMKIAPLMKMIMNLCKQDRLDAWGSLRVAFT